MRLDLGDGGLALLDRRRQKLNAAAAAALLDEFVSALAPVGLILNMSQKRVLTA